MVEFLLKLIALGPAKFFRDRWNHIDLIVLLTFFLEIQSYLGHYTGYYLAVIDFCFNINYAWQTQLGNNQRLFSLAANSTS